jgi:urea transport system substrate-binding protein
MGIVFEAEDLALGRRVAVKVLRPDVADEVLRQRFLQEARLAASLRHDHIVTIYQVGQQGGLPFLVMEYLHGESLEQRLERAGWLPVAEAIRIVRQVAEGLQAAHAAGLIHRDVKPANIWLETEGPGGSLKRVKLLDFGLARPVQPGVSLTRHGEILGTPWYMAPEQVYGGSVDARTDVYALGCTLYRMLSGRVPFEKEQTLAVLEAVVNEELPPVEELAPRISRSVAGLLRQLLSKAPDQRPASAATVAARLRALEHGDSVALPGQGFVPPPPPTTASALSGRQPAPRLGLGVWAGALIILLAVVAGLAVGYKKLFHPGDEGKPAGPGEAKPAEREPLKIGVLHSLTGTYADNERVMADAILLAVDEINEHSGVLGRKIQPVLKDGASDELLFADLAEKLIKEDGVMTLFGCWSSASRKRVAAVCAKHDHLLVYSVMYEGLEQSPYVIYVGGAPNQQLQPVARWAYADLAKRRFFLVGSENVSSRASNQILKHELLRLGAEVVGEEYVPVEGTQFAPIVDKIKATQADLVLNTVDGGSNLAFFQAMRAGRVRPDRVPTLWLGIGEAEMGSLSLREMVGDYSAWPYFQSVEGEANQEFLKRFQARYPTRQASDAAVVSYCAVYLWKQAVEAAGSADVRAIRQAFRGQKLDAPEGPIRIDPDNQHAWRMARIAQLTESLRFKVVHRSVEPLAPEPFPRPPPRAEWEVYLKSLYDGWGQRWEGPRR